jgi:hypothetical protein
MSGPKLLDLAILKRDIPALRLAAGHAGTVVESYDDGSLMLEFIDEAGDTVALVTLRGVDVRKATSAELKHPSRPDALPPGEDAPIFDATGLTLRS